MRIVVLLGGWSLEREVSLSSGQGVIKALQDLGHEVISIDPPKNLSQIAAMITEAKPETIFNALHGVGGEDGTIQGCLNVLGIPYTHSGVLASALAMDKYLSGKIFTDHALKIPTTYLLPAGNLKKETPPLPYPFVVKPVNEGSTVGVSIVRNHDDWKVLAHKPWNFGPNFLAQPYVKGREIHVAIMDNQALGTVEIIPKSGFYDYTAKYTVGMTEYIVPAPLTTEEQSAIFYLAEQAHILLGCRGLSRVDCIYDGKDFILLEVNTQPGFTPTSLVPKIAAHRGIIYKDLVHYLVENAQVD